MTVYADYRGNHVCAITGAATDIRCCTLIQNDVLKEDEEKIVAMEWTFGLARGGLKYYLQSRENYVPFREDISRLFSRGEFVLAPTYKTYIEAMHFVNRIGIHDRRTTDRSPPRPLTALASHEGTYRYVFLPYTDAARKLQSEFGLAQQTAEDLNDGIDPLTNAPYDEGTDRFPVVECHAHPFSVAIHAYHRLWSRSTSSTAQWHSLVWEMTQAWSSEYITPPRWFVDSPRYSLHDENLSPSEASGYLPALPAHLRRPEPINILRDCKIPEENCPDKCAKWAFEVPPDAPPPKEDPPCHPYRERRSVRIARRAHPYLCSSESKSASEDCGGPLPSPMRKGRRALQTCKRDPVKNPPWWASRNGRFPTERFCSNDWAYFRFNLRLASPEYT